MSPRPDRPLVSVVLPVRNGEPYLAEALESVVAQTYRPIEIVVIDNGSTDRSAEIAAGFPGVRLISCDSVGVAPARNAGIRSARGILLALFDADDIWEPEKIDTQTAFLSEHPEIGVCAVKLRIFFDKTKKPPAWLRPELRDGPVDGLIPSALVVRREVFDRIGFFEEGLISDDTDWLRRVRNAGIEIAVVPQILLRRRIHTGNVSGGVAAVHASLLEICRRQTAHHRDDD